MSEHTGGTRARIKDVALDLFSEQGYEKTSLREIAERLGVTKAALYYHFKSKEEIVASFVDDRLEHLATLIEWARSRPPGPATRAEVLRRYADALHESGHPRMMRFFEQNQPALKGMTAGQRLREQMFELVHVLSEPDPSPAEELRTGLALFALHTAWLGIMRHDLTDEQRREVALQVAYELVGRREGKPAATGTPVPVARAEAR
jgi:AcrR family transcriptional regulator